MGKSLPAADWYFDFVSPYAYLGFTRLAELSGLARLRLRPVLFAGLLGHFGQKGPAEIAPKRTWTYRATTWLAREHGIAFAYPAAHPFNSLPYLRLAIAAGGGEAAVGAIFRALWTTRADAADPAIVAGLARELGVDPARIAEPAVKEALREETAQAAGRGVFGVPTLAVRGELFWGADAMDFAKAFLADPGLLATDEMRRLDRLPVGAERKAP